MELIIPDIAALPGKVSELIPSIRECKIVLLYGEMGVGKTTFVQECLRQLGVEHPEGSPTYALINVYETSEGKIYHLDLYRVNSQDEIYDLGIEDLLDSDSICFIEWPQKIEKMLYGSYLELQLELQEDLTRKITAQKKAV